jgi:hypothetical protein
MALFKAYYSMATYRLAEIVRAKEKIALIDSAMTNERMTSYVQKAQNSSLSDSYQNTPPDCRKPARKMSGRSVPIYPGAWSGLWRFPL